MFPNLSRLPSEEKLEKLFHCRATDTKIFDHSKQSYRLLRWLEKGGRGLDLTLYTYYGVLRTSMPTRDDDGFELHFEQVSTDFASFEAHTVRVADDIAWVNHDLTEDCLKAQRKPEDLLQEYYDEFGKSELNVHFDDMLEFLRRAPGERYGMFITDVIEFNKEQLTPRGYLASKTGEAGYLIGLSEETSDFLQDMKRIVVATIHDSVDVKHIATQSKTQVEKICEFLADLTNFRGHIPIELCHGRTADDLSHLERLRAVVDYVALMTDSEADKLYQQHWGAYRGPAGPARPVSDKRWPLW